MRTPPPFPTSSQLAEPSGAALELTWEMFGELCRALALKVAGSDFRPEVVVGIAKAGVIPGAVISSILRADFFSLKVSRNPGLDLERMDRPEILSEAPLQARGRNVLLVDEICTSGETLRVAGNALRNVAPREVRTATSIVKVNGHRPDYFALETDAEVVFPWDRHVVNPDGALVPNPAYRDLLD
ncbi:MAG TPA: phosphoribosyltransferase family protein [Longimicrobiales bacterium]|nr:phosphoribosyltransferase family protein [Longimicrobiales bacterium]